MEKGNSIWRGNWGGISISVLIAAVVALIIWVMGDAVGLNSTGLKILGFALATVLLLLISHGNSIALTLKQQWSRFQAKRENILPADENRLQQTAPRNVTANTIRQAMRDLYGLSWGRKTRILLITGTVSDVEQLIPGLTDQLWQEDRGTLLLWGGDLSTPGDRAWFEALRKLRRRPVDGLVWVTSAFDQLSSPELETPLPVPSESTMNSMSHAISARMNVLGWKIPLYVWSLHPRAGKPEGRIVQAAGCLLPPECGVQGLSEQLAVLQRELTSRGLQQIYGEVKHNFLLALADQLNRDPESITTPLSVMFNPRCSLLLAGVVFSQPSVRAEHALPHHWVQDKRWEVLPVSFYDQPVHLRALRSGLPWKRVLVTTAYAVMVLWTVGMLFSYANNRSIIVNAGQVSRDTANNLQSLTDRLGALGKLQDVIGQLQYHEETGASWYSRLGLNKNEDLLATLWPQYGHAAFLLLRDAAAAHLTTKLEAFAALSPDSPLRESQAKQAYAQLKLYLMLARPEHMDAAWFSHALMQEWPHRKAVEDAYWQGAGEPLLKFLAGSMPEHPSWAMQSDDKLIGQVRALLVRQMGVSNSESRQYQRVLNQVARQYADMHLADMTGDTDAGRLFTTDEVVPGMFTRQAWEDGVKPAIEKVARERREEMDWVLSDAPPPAGDASSPEALEARLTSRYFSDYSAAWLNFLNSLRLQPAPTLSDAIDQLTLMADVRQSPLVALMNTLSVQGRTGQSGDAIADSLVKSAQNLLSREKRPAIDQNSGPGGPLDATFGPLLALMDNQGSSSMSLRTFLTRVTQVRLRLQQVTNAADPQAMTQTLAQTVFQGKTVDLTDTRDYGSLVAAGLGQEWSGFGQTVFVRPMEQAWQQVLRPAAESLNARWQQAVVNEWNSAFGGRYPFKNVSSEVSLPLLAKYLNADNGRITRFLQSRLSGVLHREGTRWVPDSINAQGLTFNPAFLKAMNQLSRISDVVFTRGEAGLHFELRPGTAADVMQTDLIIDSQKLTYMNQQPVWKRFTWPADTEAPGASLSWISTKAGTRQYGDMPGSWGLIRLLDKAQVSANPGISSSWQLTWQAPDGRPLNYILRTEAGEGPLALLKLRNFTLPNDIFIISDTPDVPDETFVSEEDS
ncbi:TPA: type VI secretion protein VasK [Serratia fonticola]|nr:type VI secretion protein VasK [Serratia fonticola]